MTDISTNVEGIMDHGVEAIGKWIARKVTPVTDSVAAVATHNIIAVPAKCFVPLGFVVITTTFTSTSSNGTVTFQSSGSGPLSAAYTADGTECAANDVIILLPNDLEDTAGSSLYSTSASTIDMVVGTNALTAGVFTIYCLIIDVITE